MAEILTESFCERCGTRYTFESAAPPATKGVGKFRVLSKGLKNFVLDDNASLDEALAAAKSEAEGTTTTQQLDAFHQTFNFCMSCRQYTCANCWNEADGRCLTCAPLIDGGLADDPTPTTLGITKGRSGRAAKAAAKRSVDALAWPTTDLRRFENAAPPTPEPVKPAKPLFDIAPDPLTEQPAAEAAPEPTESTEASDAVAAVSAAEPVVSAEPDLVAPEDWPDVPSLSERMRMISGPLDAESEGPAAAAEPLTPPASEAPAAAPGKGVLGRFRPGQSLDDVLDAFEAERREDEAEIEAKIWAGGKRAARPAAAKPAARETDAWPEQDRPRPAGKPSVPEPEPVAYADEPETEPETWPAEPQAEPEPLAAAPDVDAGPSLRDGGNRNPRGRAPRGDDRVEVPTWPVVPAETPHVPPRPDPRHPIQPTAMSAQVGRAQGKPEWPEEPPVDNLAFLANRGGTGRALDDVWAASSRDVLTASGSPTAAAGVQSCSSCGLSLSVTARFCRRCGTRQG
jgi:hypothetical protein